MKLTTNFITGMAIASSLLFTGCATTELQTQSKMTRSVFITPVKKSERIIYVDVKNTSGQDLNNLLSLTEQKLTNRGYKLTDDPEIAKYILVANVLFANNKKENNATGGALALGAAGAGVGAYNSNSAGGVVAGGLIGAGIGALVGKLTEDTIYQMVVDINVKERTDQKVFTSTGANTGQAKVQDSRRAGFMNSFGGTVRSNEGGGSLNDNIMESSNQHYETNFIEKNTRIFAEATKMNLELAEALPILENKMSSQIAGIF